MKIALFGGTFDPIHIGHLILIENCINQMNLDKVIVLPNSNPPHKLNNKKTDSKIRLEMVNKAVKDNKKIIVSDYECKDNNIHYTYKTLSYFNNLYKNDDIYFIMGEDSFLQIEEWKNYKEVLKNKLIIFKRYSGKNPSLDEKISHFKKINRHIYLLDELALDISSSLIRSLVKDNKSIKYLVLDEVLEIIRKRHLYVWF